MTLKLRNRKQDVMHSLLQFKKEELQKLCCEVKETVAGGIVFRKAEVKTKEASSGIADPWSLRRRINTARGIWDKKNRIFLSVDN